MGDQQLQHLLALRNHMQSDVTVMSFYRRKDGQRDSFRGDIVALLHDFLTGNATVEEFRAEFDQRTRTDWDGYGFKGMSGAMFLNKLVKHIQDTDELVEQLRVALSLPTSVDDARERMGRFQAYLEELIESGMVARGQIQPARLPYFLSACWHVQQPDAWPVYYHSARLTLEAEGLYTTRSDPTESYFAFRQAYLQTALELGLGVQDFEHFCMWYQERDIPDVVEPELITIEPEVTAVSEQEVVRGESEHSHAQWLLAKIGNALGIDVWIASNDKNRTWQGQRLGDLSIEQLPPFPGVGPKTQRLIELIDVLWLDGYRIVAAFEVEHTTSIYSGLLRMSDLTVAMPNFNFALYIVVPETRLDKVKSELSRPTFQQLELHNSCAYFSYETLVQEADHIMRYASDPKILHKLAQKVGDQRFD